MTIEKFEDDYQGEQIIAVNNNGIYSQMRLYDNLNKRHYTTTAIVRFDKQDVFLIMNERNMYHWIPFENIKNQCRKDEKWINTIQEKEGRPPFIIWPVDSASAYWSQKDTSIEQSIFSRKCYQQNFLIVDTSFQKNSDSIIYKFLTCSEEIPDLAKAINEYRRIIEQRVFEIDNIVVSAGFTLDEDGYIYLGVTPLAALSHDSLTQNLISLSQETSEEFRCNSMRKKKDPPDCPKICQKTTQSVIITDYNLEPVPDSLFKLPKRVGKRGFTKRDIWELAALLML